MPTTRKASNSDIPFIEEHASRLLEFGPPSWRKPDIEKMVKADIRHNTEAILSTDPGVEVFIALDDEGNRAGFLHLTLQIDYYTGEQHAHITDIVVVKSAEGKGIGKFLMEEADEWARKKNSRWITLNVFEDNRHAQLHYEKAGYKREWIKYLKEL